MDFSWDELRDYMLGGERVGPGLIRRVQHRVEQLSSSIGLGLSLRYDWYIPTRGAFHSQEDSEGLIEKVIDLATALNEWSGNGIGTSAPGSERHLLKYLRDNRITDVEYLTGSHGRLQRTREELKDLMGSDEPTERDRERALELMRYLKGWMGDCDHDFQEEPADDGIQVWRCECGARYSEVGGQRWAVGG